MNNISFREHFIIYWCIPIFLITQVSCVTIPPPSNLEQIDSPSVQPNLFSNNQKSNPISLDKVLIDINFGTEVGNYGIRSRSPNYTHALCPGTKVTYGSEKINSAVGNSEGEFGRRFFNVMQGAGYQVTGDPQIVFDRDEDKQKGRYRVAGRIIKLWLNACEILPRGSNDYIGKAKIDVDWHIYDSLKRTTVKRFKTVGYAVSHNFISGMRSIFVGAFEKATRELANDKDFFELVLVKEDDRIQLEPVTGEGILIQKTKPYPVQGVNQNVDSILGSVVTLRTSSGHGSGFVIDKSGLILTNAHVVGESTEILIIFNSGLELKGAVLRKDKHRDVALIKVNVGGLKPIPIRMNSINITEPVFAVGTPLQEGLKATVTRGIVSALRKEEASNLEYIQSDVAIQSGNSGGPLLDKSGNIVGISVAGYGLKGFSSGINLFIPIKDGLRWLNIKIDENQSPKTKLVELESNLPKVKAKIEIKKLVKVGVVKNIITEWGLFVTSLEPGQKINAGDLVNVKGSHGEDLKATVKRVSVGEFSAAPEGPLTNIQIGFEVNLKKGESK
tara:strand:- start:603 stop:2276 length:1674 start_codon:yes stop_codon:yes gene_type:complete